MRKATWAFGSFGIICLGGLLAVVVPMGCYGQHGAGPDAGVDAGGADAGEPPGDAGDGSRVDAYVPSRDWVSVAGLPPLPDGCHIERAVSPEHVFTPHWRSCGEGCLELERRIRDGETLRFGRAGYGPNGLHFLAIVKRQIREGHFIEDPWDHDVLCSEDRAILAYRMRAEHPTRPCAFKVFADDGYAVGQHLRFEGEDWTQTTYYGPLPGDWTSPQPDFVLPIQYGNALQKVELSGEVILFQVQPADWVMMVDARTGEWRRLSHLPERHGSPQLLHLVGDHAIWEAWGNEQIWLEHATLSGDTALFYEVPDGGDVRGSATDGIDLVWMEAHGRPCVYGCPEPYERVEIWTAPYTRDPAALEPRFVARARARGGNAKVAGHRYAYLQRIEGDTGEPTYEIVIADLADGRQRAWRAPAPWEMYSLLAMSEEEMLVEVRSPENGQDGTLFRVRFDSLPYE